MALLSTTRFDRWLCALQVCCAIHLQPATSPVRAVAFLLLLQRHSSRRNDVYNILWAVVFGFATLNILSLAARRFEPNRRGLTFGELMAVLIVLLSIFLLGWELLKHIPHLSYQTAWLNIAFRRFCGMIRKVAKNLPNFEVTCPCCNAVLKIDAAMQAVIAHTAAVKPRMFADMEDAARAMKEQDTRRESIFRQSVEAQNMLPSCWKKSFKRR